MIDTPESGGWEMVTVIDGEGRILRQSSGVEEVLGYSSGEMLGGDILDFIHRDDMAAAKKAFHQSTGESGISLPFELRWLHRDGSPRWLQTVRSDRLREAGEMVCGSRDVTSRVGAERSLSDSERRFRAIVESSLEIVKLVSTSGKLLYANPAFETVYGYDPVESVASGMNVLDYVHPDDLPRVLEDTERTLARIDNDDVGGPLGHTTEYRFLCADGSYCWIEGVGTYLLDEPGLEGVIIHARNITERRGAEDALRESEELRRVATGGAPVVLLVLDSGGVFTLSEGRGLQALGLGQNEIVGRSIYELHREEPRILENNRRALAGEEVTDTVEHDGLYFETRYSPLWGADGRPEGAICVATDVTERVRSEAEIRMKDRALEASSNGILITDPNLEDNPIIYTNPAFQRISGYEFDEIIGRNCRMFQGEDRDQPELPTLAEAVAAGREHSCTIRNYKKDGTLFYNELYVAPVRDASGGLTHFVGIQNDVTRRRELEEELSHRAFHDPLTDLPNRSLFIDRLENALARAGRHGKPVSVLFMDLDDFKSVNDASGHETGDELLVTVARRLRGILRPEDTVCRLGGDEFVLLLENAGESEVSGIAERMAAALREPVALQGAGLKVSLTTSLGVAVALPGPGREYTPQYLLREADAAMYRAKRSGKSSYEVSVFGR